MVPLWEMKWTSVHRTWLKQRSPWEWAFKEQLVSGPYLSPFCFLAAIRWTASLYHPLASWCVYGPWAKEILPLLNCFSQIILIVIEGLNWNVLNLDGQFHRCFTRSRVYWAGLKHYVTQGWPWAADTPASSSWVVGLVMCSVRWHLE